MLVCKGRGAVGEHIREDASSQTYQCGEIEKGSRRGRSRECVCQRKREVGSGNFGNVMLLAEESDEGARNSVDA